MRYGFSFFDKQLQRKKREKIPYETKKNTKTKNKRKDKHQKCSNCVHSNDLQYSCSIVHVLFVSLHHLQKSLKCVCVCLQPFFMYFKQNNQIEK